MAYDFRTILAANPNLPAWWYGWNAPAYAAEAVTPHDSTNLTNAARSFYVGTGGNVAVVTLNGDVVTFSNVASGSVLPVAGTRINSTNTTASSIVALR